MGLLTRIGSVVGSLGCAAAVVVGCNNGPDDVAHNEFQAKMVHALCDSVQSCCTSAQREFNAMFCRDSVIRQFVNPLSNTSLRYDSAQAGACIDAVNRAAQACDSVDPTTCYNAFIGNKPPGAPCQLSFECAPGPGGYSVCDQTNVCVQPNRGVPGEVCSFTCIESGGGAPRCKSVFYGTAGVAAACHSENGLACITNVNGPATCQSMAVDCKQNPSGACPPGYLCDVASDRCYVPVPLGGPCTQVPCGTDGYCAGGICVPLKANAINCVDDAECQSGKCENTFCVVYSKAAKTWCGEIMTH